MQHKRCESITRMGDYVVLGELVLDGRVKGIKGALASTILARSRGLAFALAGC